MLFGRWVMLSLYCIYKFTYSHNRLQRNGFFGRLYTLYTVIFVLSLVAHAIHSHIHTHMPSFKTVHNAQTNITLGAKIRCAPSFVLHCTHTAMMLFPFWGPMLGMFHFQVTYLGYRCTRSPSRYATCSHIILVGFHNQITNENLLEPFVCHFTTTCFMEQEGIEDGHIYQVEKQFLSPLPCSPGNSVTIHHPIRFVHISHVSIIVLYYMKCYCTARFVAEIAFHWRSMHICENTDITFILPAYNTLISSIHVIMSPFFAFIAQDEMSLGIPCVSLWTVLQHLFSFQTDRRMEQATRNNYPYIVYGLVLPLFLPTLKQCHVLLTFPVLPRAAASLDRRTCHV